MEYKEAKSFHKWALPIFFCLCLLIFMTGCDDGNTEYVIQNCTVSEHDEYLIQCPDGTEIMLPDNVETEIVIVRDKKKNCSNNRRRK